MGGGRARPFIIVAPGLAKPGSVCNRTVDYMSVYPTVCELCQAPKPAHVQGLSLLPLLANPTAAWDRPAVTTHSQNNNTVRSERWRYIRYADGSEELYDELADRNEWANLATDPHYAPIKAGLATWLPTSYAAPAPGSAERTLTYANGIACWEGRDIPTGAPVPGLDQD